MGRIGNITIRPGLPHAVVRVYKEWEEATNGIIPAITIDLPSRARVADAYVSPTITEGTFTNFLTLIITTGTGRDWQVGDLNARDPLWDTTGNATGCAIRRRINGNQVQTLVPAVPTFHARERRATSNPDLVVTNVKDEMVESKRERIWRGVSDHTPILLKTT